MVIHRQIFQELTRVSNFVKSRLSFLHRLTSKLGKLFRVFVPSMLIPRYISLSISLTKKSNSEFIIHNVNNESNTSPTLKCFC
jgi:hypothetical protein